MRVLVLGAGAKDHAIAWWFSRSNYLSDLFCAPGNIATKEFATNLPDVDPASPEQVLKACTRYKIDFVFAGTEAPLFTGVIDHLASHGIGTFGCPRKSLKLEGDRNFARAFTDRHNIPTPRRNLFENREALKRFLSRHEGEHFVLKSNTIAPSRIMLDSMDTNALLKFADVLFQKGPVLLEEHRKGTHITATVLLDNNGYFPLPLTSDYMYTAEEDGIPTGGMGSICPIYMREAIWESITEQIIKPTIYGLKVEQLSYKGVLTISIVVDENSNPIVVDYHIRFNDPATQAMVPLIKNDIIELLYAMKEDRLSEEELRLTEESSVAVVLASENYPMAPQVGRKVEDVNPLLLYNTFSSLPLVFTGAVKGDNLSDLYTAGGRNFTFVGRGENIKTANENAYRLINKIHFDGSWYREDIGNRFISAPDV